jgi:hypothetical protein
MSASELIYGSLMFTKTGVELIMIISRVGMLLGRTDTFWLAAVPITACFDVEYTQTDPKSLCATLSIATSSAAGTRVKEKTKYRRILGFLNMAFILRI